MQNVLKRKSKYFVEKFCEIYLFMPVCVLDHSGSFDMHIKKCKKKTPIFFGVRKKTVFAVRGEGVRTLQILCYSPTLNEILYESY